MVRDRGGMKKGLKQTYIPLLHIHPQMHSYIFNIDRRYGA